MTLDRINVNGDYEPDNCRWATTDVQRQNTRDIYSTNTSGFRGVSYDKKNNNWASYIIVNNKRINIGRFKTALEAAKAYEIYVRVLGLEHNFTPSLTPENLELFESFNIFINNKNICNDKIYKSLISLII